MTYSIETKNAALDKLEAMIAYLRETDTRATIASHIGAMQTLAGMEAEIATLSANESI